MIAIFVCRSGSRYCITPGSRLEKPERRGRNTQAVWIPVGVRRLAFAGANPESAGAILLRHTRRLFDRTLQ